MFGTRLVRSSASRQTARMLYYLSICLASSARDGFMGINSLYLFVNLSFTTSKQQPLLRVLRLLGTVVCTWSSLLFTSLSCSIRRLNWFDLSPAVQNQPLSVVRIYDAFLPRDALLSAGYMPSSCVCVSVCLSHSGIVSKRLYVGSRKQRSTITP